MMTRNQEIQQLRTKISGYDGNLALMQDLMNRTPSEPLRQAMNAEQRQRDAARSRLAKLEEIIALEAEINTFEESIAQQERSVQTIREELDAVQRRLTQAETDLTRTRIEMNNRQTDLQQKKTELDQLPGPTAAPYPVDAPTMPASTSNQLDSVTTPMAGGTMRLGQVPPTVLRLSDGRVEQVVLPTVVLGRDAAPGVDIALGEQTVSGMHARLNYTNNQWTLVDLGSANGTWVNNQPLAPNTPVVLDHGTTLHFGRAVIMFETEQN